MGGGPLTDKLISRLFVFAGLSNILGILIFSRLFTNQVMMETQPAIMGMFGLISIILWGGAYISVSKTFDNVRWLIGVFVVEKLVYVVAWVSLVSSQSLAEIFAQDAFAGIFYTVYGPNDFMFMMFFAYVFLTKGKRG